MAWSVTAEPEGKNPGVLDKAKSAVGIGTDPNDGSNVGGMIIFIVNGATKQEVSRVAWIRRNSKNPSTSFEKQLQAELDKARASVKILNENTNPDRVLS